ncbi:transglycosylase SLT domain-containing protein [Roseateles koreensis]|uniref:Transglycosylase SLT domain-containing protein n=1 Tax=Roseateles koreensis TaxID=2987526 RepID=A0ABT5KR52_9BURK|nr:transglycosylase SLT domain-containing protein [Roseateles koreensis]MDC8784356.1 transglycosylase SLT domain-containing protein [Roseateles koreensis]
MTRSQSHFSRPMRRNSAPLALLLTLLLSACASTGTNTSTDTSTAASSDRRLQSRSWNGSTAQSVVAKVGAATGNGDASPLRLEDSLNPGIAVDLTQAAAKEDLWLRLRTGFAMQDLDNDLVHKAENWYSSRPDYVARMTERGSRYLYHIIEEVEKRGMPTELALLPFIESAFNPQAMSTAQASGMWQFVPATGRDFDLKQNIFRDDRRDVLASTRAALDYLVRLNKKFGNWQLALAAYNWGQGNVQRAIDRNLKAGLPTDFENLRMPEETRYYVPKLQAVKNIVISPEKFGLRLPEMDNHPYFLSVNIDRDMDVDVAARLAGMSVEEFKQFNPQMNKPVMLAAKTTQVLLPYDNASAFAVNLAAHRGPLASWTAWVVPKTMKSADAAKQVGMPEAQLLDVNKIPPRMLVKQGSTLLVPRAAHREDDVSEHLADNASLALAPDVPPLQKRSLRAGKNDSVASVAARYRVNAAQLAQWNNVDARARFKPGQSIVLYAANAASQKADAGAGKTSSSSSSSSSRKAASSKAGGVRTAQTNRGNDKAAKPARSSKPVGRSITAAVDANKNGGDTGGFRQVSHR